MQTQTRRPDTSPSTPRRLRRYLTVGAIASLALASSAYAASFKGASIPSQTDTVSSSYVAPVKVACPSGTKTGCSGTLTLKTSKAVQPGSVPKLGTQSFSIAPGKTAVVKVKLNSEGKSLLSSGTLTPVATAASRDGSGTHKTRSTKITLKKSSSSATPPPSALY